MKKVIISTSTFKSDQEDSTPDFINSMVESLSDTYENLEIIVFRPMKDKFEQEYFEKNYKVVPYRYHWSVKKQTLWKYGLKPAYDLNKLNIFKILLLFISQIFALIKLIKSEKPDYIYSQWFIPQALTAAIVCKFYPVKNYFSTYGADVLLVKNIPLVGKKVINFVIKNTTKFTAISSLNLNIIKSALKQELLDRNNYKVLPLPIEEVFFQRNPQNKHDQNIINFLYIGRLIEVKGVDLLIESFDSIHDKENIILNIVGTGIDKVKLEEKSKNLNLSNNILFHGWKNNDEKMKFFDQANVVFVTSKQNNTIMEGGPLTLIEAMSQNIICICSDSVGYSEHIIDGYNGIVFKSGSSQSLTNAINRYLNLSDDQIKAIQNNAFQTSQQFKRIEITKDINKYFFKN